MPFALIDKFGRIEKIEEETHQVTSNFEWVQIDVSQTSDYSGKRVINGQLVDSADELQNMRAQKTAEVNRIRAQKIEEGFIYKNKKYQMDIESRANACGAALLMHIKKERGKNIKKEKQVWRTMDNENVEFDSEEFLDFAEKMAEVVDAIYKTSFNIKEQILKQELFEAVASLDIEKMWPTGD